MKRFYIIIGAVAVLGVVALTLVLRGGGSAATEPVDLGEVADAELLELAQGIVYGDQDAPVTIMEFGNYQCPACQAFALQVKPQVELAYIDDGRAKLVYYDFPTPGLPHSFLAARAARCAGDQDSYWSYHDAVYRTLRDWSLPRSPVGHFEDLAQEVDLDSDAFDECLNSDRHADVVTANLQLGQRLGVPGTPTIFVHGGSGPANRLGGFQFIDIQRAMDEIEQSEQADPGA